jgi:hypothetical protein
MRAALAAAVGTGLTLVPTASTAAAETPDIACGAVIAESVTLTHDVTGCAEGGVVINTDNVTLDLGGHAIGGVGTGWGVRITGSNVRVVNGSIRGFSVGVYIGADYRHPVLGGELARLSVTDNSQGITASYARGTRFEANTLSHNDHWGMSSYEVHEAEVTNNTLVGNGDGGLGMQDTGGTFEQNRALHNGGIGMAFWEPYAVALSGNRADDNQTSGIAMSNHFGFSGVVIMGNTANRNGEYGIAVARSYWPSPLDLPTDGGGNSAWRNGNAAECLNVACAITRGQASS